MRTTLTLDDDVAAALTRRVAEHGTTFKGEVNDLLRSALAAPPATDPGPPFRTPVWDSGRALITDHRAWKDLLDDEDVERGMPRSS